MAPAKKRKRDGESSTPVMSAFALRRKLLGQTAPTAAPIVDGPNEDPEGQARPSRTRAHPVEESASLSPEKPSPLAHGPSHEAPVLPQDGKPSSPAAADLNGVRQKTRPVQHSTFKPTKKNFQEKNDGTVVLRLPEGERIVVLGSYGVRVSHGEATLAGATLRPSQGTHWVHAPHCHAVPVLRCSDETAIELRHHPDADGLRLLEGLSPVFSKLWNEPILDQKGVWKPNTFQVIYTSSDMPKRALLQELVSPSEWNKKIAELAMARQPNSLSVFVCGPKASGKSTFSRLLANRWVTDDSRPRNNTWAGVAILDIDPGQPDFSTPGNVSLVHLNEPILSPSFCRPFSDRGNIKAIRSHALASVSPAADPEHYFECVIDLFDRYQGTLRGKCPLLINTPGWVQGTGLDLLTRLVAKLRPSDVIYMSQEGPEETVEALKSALRGAELNELPSQPSEYTSRTALHLRTMHTMSYFHIEPALSGRGQTQWNPEPLTSVPPLVVSYGGGRRGIYAIMCYDYQPPLTMLAEAINGALVSIVEIEDKAAFQNLHTLKSRGAQTQVEGGLAMELDEKPWGTEIDASRSGTEDHLIQHSDDGLPVLPNPDGCTLDPRYSQVVGTALVRGVDTRQQSLHLLCPLLPQRFSDVIRAGHKIVLVLGKLDSPTWAYTEDAYKRSSESSTRRDVDNQPIGLTDADTDDDTLDVQEEVRGGQHGRSDIPWVEELHGSEKRAVGSRVWRVRRDLGRTNNATD